MPSAAGKRVGRVLAGVRSQRQKISRAPYLASDLSHEITCQVSKAHVGIRVHFVTGLVIMRHAGIQEFTWFSPFLPFHPESPFLDL